MLLLLVQAELLDSDTGSTPYRSETYSSMDGYSTVLIDGGQTNPLYESAYRGQGA